VVHADLEGGDSVSAAHVVIATNGFIVDRDANLNGRMRSYWTFLVAFDDPGENTPNAYYFDRVRTTGAPGRKLIVGARTRRWSTITSMPAARRALRRAAGALVRRDLPSLAGRREIALHYSVFGETATTAHPRPFFAGEPPLVRRGRQRRRQSS